MNVRLLIGQVSVIMIFLVFWSSLIGNNDEQTKQKNEIVSILNTEDVKRINDVIKYLEANNELVMNKDIRKKLCELYAFKKQDFLRIAPLLNSTSDRIQEKESVTLAISEKEIKGIIRDIDSGDYIRVKSGIDKLEKFYYINNNPILKKENFSVAINETLIEKIANYIDNENRFVEFDNLLERMLFKWDRHEYEKRLSIFLKSNDSNIKMRALQALRHERKLLNLFKSDLVEACKGENSDVFKSIAVDTLLGLKNSKINDEICSIPGLLVDITDILRSVVRAYASGNATELLDVSMKTMFVVANNYPNETSNNLFPSNPESTNGYAGSFENALKYLKGEFCLSVDQLNDVQIIDRRVIQTSSGKFFINIDKTDNHYTHNYFKENYFGKLSLDPSNYVFCINMKSNNSGKNETYSCLNEYFCAVVIWKDKLMLAGILGLENPIDY